MQEFDLLNVAEQSVGVVHVELLEYNRLAPALEEGRIDGCLQWLFVSVNQRNQLFDVLLLR